MDLRYNLFYLAFLEEIKWVGVLDKENQDECILLLILNISFKNVSPIQENCFLRNKYIF